MLIVFDRQVRRGLATLMSLSGTRPVPWTIVSALLLLAQTALATIPVVSMVPLLQLFTSPNAVPQSVQIVADVIGTTDSRVLIPVFAACIGVVFLVCSGLTVLVTRMLAGRTNRIGAVASTELLRRYASESFESHRRRANAEVIRNVNLAQSSSNALSFVLSIYTSLLTLFGLCVVLLIASPLVTILVIVLFGGVMSIAQRFLRRAQRQAGEKSIQAALRGWEIVLPVIEGFREVRLAASADRLLSSYRRSQLELMQSNRSATTLGAVPPALSQVVFAFAIAGISTVLFTTGSAGAAITILGLFAAAAMRALPTVNLLFAAIGWVRNAEPALQAMADAAHDVSAASDAATRISAPIDYRGDIVVDRLTFTYSDSDEAVLKGIDLVIKEHQTTAIVGSSGAGKSTLIDLILGLLTPTGGEVTCGGTSIFADRSSWYENLAVVPQDVFLLNDTLGANVTFGEPVTEANRPDIVKALAFAQLSGLVAELPDGLDTAIGERGTRLSGGQRQRLGLARAMFRKPRVLLLDEATSALDNETEAEITDALRALHGSVTVIVVAHRLSTVRNADHLVFLDRGTTAGEGTFEEVRDSTPAFERLVELGKLP